MRRRQLKGLWARLKELHRMSVNLTRDELLDQTRTGQSQVAERHCHTNRFYWSLLTPPPAPDLTIPIP